ncbi:MAG: gamma-glutamyltransferase, partial [Lentisphaeraceae bacterium]|nr:gamma-glutamyltransferase [Lentisphaeraceae bacterium]
VLALLVFSSLFLHAAQPPIINTAARIHPQSASKAMIVCQDEPAADIALEILKNGGNAADAAVALAYALAVTQPKAGNLGGGGFALYYEAATGKTKAIDFREMAPLASSKNMYLDDKGNVDQQRVRFSAKACGVPGTVAGLEFISKKYGKLKHSELLQGAIKLADEGFPVSTGLAYDLIKMKEPLMKSATVRELFYPKGEPLERGEIFVQKNLAKTLKILATKGAQNFYTGKIAEEFCRWHQENDGIISLDDMKNYKVRLMDAVSGTYRGYKVMSMPPPSSGGVHLIQILNILEKWNLEQSGHNSASTIHLMTESMKLAYADRSKYLGDPDYVQIPVKGLIDKKYAAELRKKINIHRATPSQKLAPGKPGNYESPDTTHFSIADQYGNVISFTYTINFSFGSRLMIPELGFFLNNEMDDFSAKPGTANAYGLVGGEANAVQAGKRPLSSMTPTIVFKEGKPWLVTGSPGGSRIITTVLQVIVNMIDHKMNLAEAVIAPRIHHQWLPDSLKWERGLSYDTIQLLNYLGHGTLKSSAFGCAESILIEGGNKYGFADPRRLDGKAVGF